MAYEIREMKLGEILDQGLAVLKDNFGLFFKIMLYVYIPYHLIATLVQVSMLPELIAVKPGANPGAPPDIKFDGLLEALPLLIGVALVGWIVIIPLTNAAVIYAVAQKYLGREVTAGGAIQKGFSKILPLLGTSILVTLSIIVPPLALIIPGAALQMVALIIVGALLMIVLAILFGIWFILTYQVVVLEDKSGPEAMGRSKKLVTPYIGNLFVLGIVLFAISVPVGASVGMISQPHLQGVCSVLVNSLVTMYSTAVFVVFYFSCRSGVENFDLEHLAGSVEESAYGDSERSPFDEEMF